MANGDDHENDAKMREEWSVRAGNKVRRRFFEDGTLSEEAICDSRKRAIEAKRFGRDGIFYQTVIYEYADEKDWRPQKTTQLDAEGDLIISLDRGSPPVIGELYAGEKPFHVYAKKKRPNQPPEPTAPSGRGSP